MTSIDDRKLARLWDAFFRKAGRWLKHQYQQQIQENCDEVTAAQYRVLFLIYQKEPCRMSDLSKEAMVSTSSLTIMLNKLVDQGLVKRQSSAKDRRVILVKLTDQGKAILQDVHRRYLSAIEEKVALLEPEQKKTLHDLLKEVNEIVKEL